MQKAIIETSTRVIRRLTTDQDPVILPDEAVIALDQEIDLEGKYYKLDQNNNKVLATEQEIDKAKVDEEREVIKFQAKKTAYIQALETAISDQNVPYSVRKVFKKLKELN